MDKKNSFIPEDDYEFERSLAEKERNLQENAEKIEAKRLEEEKLQRQQHEKELNEQKIELMKLRQGVIDSSETVKEEEKETIKLSFGEWLSNVWYRSKWLILFVIFLVFAGGYIIYDTATRVKPDLTVLVVMDNTALYVRTAETQAFFEKYAEDINGDGEINVMIYNISTDYGDPNTATSAQAQIMTQLQSGDNMIIVSDGTTDFAVHDFTGELTGEAVTDKGIKLNCQLTRDELKWQAMPDNLYIGLREPAKLLSTSEAAMKENYEAALPTYLRIYEAIEASEK